VVIVTVDLGTTVTKVDLWDESGRLASGRAQLSTTHPAPDRAEQDPGTWWPAVLAAAARARQAAPAAWSAAIGIGLSGARQTMVLVDARLQPIGPALLWSDRRAGAEAAALGTRFGGDEAVRQRTGQPLRATSVAAKLAWLGAHHPDQLARAELVLSPRDWLACQLDGAPLTEATMASASGCHERADIERAAAARPGAPGGSQGPWLVEVDHARLLPRILPLGAVAGGLRPVAATDLGLPAGIPVVLGAGDRACEVLGTGATRSEPMVSWGTTANLSQPGWAVDDPVPPGLVATRSARGGANDSWQIEGGLAAAGSLLAWLATITDRPVDDLMARAATRPPGAGGVMVLPWLAGARAPWWRDDATATVTGLRPTTEPGDLARAALEGVAYEVDRILRILDPPDALRLTGSGAAAPAWIEVVAAVSGCPVRIPRHGQAAAVGAALLTSAALGQPFDHDVLDPIERVHVPDPDLVERYRHLAPVADGLARAMLSRTTEPR
jgi:xylulokinase